MTGNLSKEYLRGLLNELRKQPKETPWLEFKTNCADPEELGEYISALANSAALNDKIHAYMGWGVENKTHDIVGTKFSPSKAKKGNENLENWLLRLLTPRIHFHFYEFSVDDKPVVLLEISRAVRQPVQFMGREYIRISSYKIKRCSRTTPSRNVSCGERSKTFRSKRRLPL